jgi:hypothetical protein
MNIGLNLLNLHALKIKKVHIASELLTGIGLLNNQNILLSNLFLCANLEE